MTEDELKKVMSTTIEETLLKLGIPVGDPIETQKDMHFVRSWRTSSEAMKKQTFLSLVVLATTGTIGLIWTFIKSPTG